MVEQEISHNVLTLIKYGNSLVRETANREKELLLIIILEVSCERGKLLYTMSRIRAIILNASSKSGELASLEMMLQS